MEETIFLKTESLSVLFRECSADIIQFLKYTNLFTNYDDTIWLFSFITVIAILFFFFFIFFFYFANLIISNHILLAIQVLFCSE